MASCELTLCKPARDMATFLIANDYAGALPRDEPGRSSNQFPLGGNCLREETRNHHPDKIDQKMPDHIREEVASLLIECGKHRTSE